MDDDPVAPAAFSAAPGLTLGTDGAGRRASSRAGGDGDGAGGPACTSSLLLALTPAGVVDGVAPVESGCLVAGGVSAAGAERDSDGWGWGGSCATTSSLGGGGSAEPDAVARASRAAPAPGSTGGFTAFGCPPGSGKAWADRLFAAGRSGSRFSSGFDGSRVPAGGAAWSTGPCGAVGGGTMRPT